MNYGQLLQSLYDASGPVETYINSLSSDSTPAGPTAAQSTLLNFLQNDFKNAIQTAARAESLPVPGTQP